MDADNVAESGGLFRAAATEKARSPIVERAVQFMAGTISAAVAAERRRGRFSTSATW